MSTPAITDAQINVLHMAYEKLSGIPLPLRSICDSRRESWARFIMAGHTLQELETVILHIKTGIRTQRRNMGALRFSTLVMDTDHFAEELGMARAEIRNAKPAPSPQQRVISQARPMAVAHAPSEKHVTARHISELIAELKQAAGMKI